MYNRLRIRIMYFLAIYVILQFVWWTYFILTLDASKLDLKARFTMILGEGSVFLLIIIFAFTRLIISLRKEGKLNEQKDNFLMSITHELKTPIAHNKLSIQTLLKRNDISEEIRIDLLHKVLTENDRLQHLVENLLTATRLETKYLKPNREKFNVYLLINRLLEHYSILFENTKINLIAVSNEVWVMADERMVETVILNIIDNFHKYASDSDEFRVIVSTFGDKVKCSFEDQGIGINDAFRKEVFKKFTRSESEEIRTKKGTGLGLYICREFLKLNGGTILCEPNQPKGTKFIISLPLA